MPEIYVERYAALPPPNEEEILRYAGARGCADGELKELLALCLAEAEPVFTFRVCYTVLKREELTALCPSARESKGLSGALGEAERTLVFAASAGIGIDRLLNKYAAVSPVKALLFQAIGAERIERLCDEFCARRAAEYGGLRSRFSPGYGEFPLNAQKEIFQLLRCSQNIGLSLTESLLMTPTKSVTAIAGIGEKKEAEERDCAVCEKKDCEYRICR